MDNKKVCIVTKAFDEQGCYAYQCKEPKELQCVPEILELLRNKDVQIFILDAPEFYSEYAPYNFIPKLQAFVEKVIALNKVA